MVNSALWHDRLGHLHHAIVERVILDLNCKISSKSSHEACGSFQFGKSYRLHTHHINQRSVSTFDIIHVDL